MEIEVDHVLLELLASELFVKQISRLISFYENRLAVIQIMEIYEVFFFGVKKIIIQIVHSGDCEGVAVFLTLIQEK